MLLWPSQSLSAGPGMARGELTGGAGRRYHGDAWGGRPAPALPGLPGVSGVAFHLRLRWEGLGPCQAVCVDLCLNASRKVVRLGGRLSESCAAGCVPGVGALPAW